MLIFLKDNILKEEKGIYLDWFFFLASFSISQMNQNFSVIGSKGWKAAFFPSSSSFFSSSYFTSSWLLTLIPPVPAQECVESKRQRKTLVGPTLKYKLGTLHFPPHWFWVGRDKTRRLPGSRTILLQKRIVDDRTRSVGMTRVRSTQPWLGFGSVQKRLTGRVPAMCWAGGKALQGRNSSEKCSLSLSFLSLSEKRWNIKALSTWPHKIELCSVWIIIPHMAVILWWSYCYFYYSGKEIQFTERKTSNRRAKEELLSGRVITE